MLWEMVMMNWEKFDGLAVDGKHIRYKCFYNGVQMVKTLESEDLDGRRFDGETDGWKSYDMYTIAERMTGADKIRP